MDLQMQFTVDDVQPAQHAAPDEPRTPARLLEYRHGAFVALPAHTTMGLIECPPVIAVPGAPYYCRGLIAWQDRLLALLDLGTLLRAYPEPNEPPIGHVLVLAWQSGPGAPLEYGAVCARSLVRMIEVADCQQCPLPGDSDLWPWISLSCFEHEGHSVPVLDTARLFGEPQP
jgi:chemotaxis signal transduction protein